MIIKDGDCRKIEILYEKYKYLLYSEAFKVLKNHHLAEDIVQQVFVKIIENVNAIEEVESNKTKNFLCIICRNLSINLSKKNNKEKFIDVEEVVYNKASDQNKFNEVIVNDANLLVIKQAIKELPDIYRDILVLEKIYGYTIKEITKILNISENVARKRSQRARGILLKKFERNENVNAGK